MYSIWIPHPELHQDKIIPVITDKIYNDLSEHGILVL